MPAPANATYSVIVLTAAQTAFRDSCDSGSAAAFLRIRTNADVLLATIPLNDPCGTVNSVTGQLTFNVANASVAAAAGGTAAYGEFCDSTGAVHLAIPTQAGTAPVIGRIVINTLTIVAAGTVQLLSATVG